MLVGIIPKKRIRIMESDVVQNPLISIVVPVYKVERFLDICLTSIVNQTYKNLEIILIEDGSPDRCGEMCDVWAKKDARICVIHQENRGAAAARNAGLDIAQGEYIGFVDSDDHIAADMYEVCLNAIKQTGCKMAICCPKGVNEDSVSLVSQTKHEQLLYNTEQAVDAVFLHQVEQAVWCKLCHRSLFEGVRFPEGVTNEDVPLIVPLFARAGGAVNTGKIMYGYRSVNGSATDTYWNKGYETVWKHLLVVERQLKEYHLENCYTSFYQLEAESCYKIALQMDKNYNRLSIAARKDSKIFRSVMRKRMWLFLFSSSIAMKDKMLYMMIISRTLRPIYMFTGKKLN